MDRLELIQKWETRSLEAKKLGQIEYYKACQDILDDLKNQLDHTIICECSVCENLDDTDLEEFEISDDDAFTVTPGFNDFSIEEANKRLQNLSRIFPTKDQVRKNPDFFNKNHPEINKILLEIQTEEQQGTK